MNPQISPRLPALCAHAAVLTTLAAPLPAASLSAPLVSALTTITSLPAHQPIPDLTRLDRPAYGDGVNTPGGSARPDVRTLSNAVSQPQFAATDPVPLSNLAVAYFQLIASHEVALTTTEASEPAPIPLSPGDPLYDAATQPMIPFSRSVSTPGTDLASPRQQPNVVTPEFDASTVYGSDAARTAILREPGSAKIQIAPDGDLAVLVNNRPTAGDTRADENPTLQSLHALFVREHNRLADEIAAECGPGCSDDQVFDAARVLVANMQHKIFYDELLPIFLGTDDFDSLLPDPALLMGAVPQVLHPFSAAAGRVGHTQVPDTILTGAPGTPLTEVTLKECFFNEGCLGAATEAEKLYGAAQQAAMPVDTVVADSLRNAQLASPGAAMVIDLLATNIARGRDHGLPDYMTMREILGFATYELDQLLPDYILQAYGGGLSQPVDPGDGSSIETGGIDLLLGLFGEFRAPGDYLGETSKALWALQWRNLEDTVYSFADADAQAALEDWRSGVSMAGLLSRDTGYDLSVWGASPFLAPPPSPVPLPPALALSLAGLAILGGSGRLRRQANA